MEFFENRVCDSLIESPPPGFKGRRAFIIDGITITPAPTEELRQTFPPVANPPWRASNQHGETAWSATGDLR